MHLLWWHWILLQEKKKKKKKQGDETGPNDSGKNVAPSVLASNEEKQQREGEAQAAVQVDLD